MPRNPRHATTPDPDSPPDSYDPTGMCPRCGRHSNFELATSFPLIVDAARDDWSSVPAKVIVEEVTVLRCRACGEGTAIIEQRQDNETDLVFRGVFWWPIGSSSSLDPSVPVALQELHAKGFRCVAAGVPEAAGVMFRRCLEGIVREKGSVAAIQVLNDPRGLGGALKVMTSDQTLDQNLSEWANEIRLGGNAGGHYNPGDDLTDSEARNLARFIEQLFTYLFEMPAKVTRARKKP
jgi:Domain of unknown function (DUF4145)